MDNWLRADRRKAFNEDQPIDRSEDGEKYASS